MDPRENLHVVDLGNANFSAAMSNVDSLEKRLYAPDAWPVKARILLQVKCFDFPEGDGSNWLSKALILPKVKPLDKWGVMPMIVS